MNKRMNFLKKKEGLLIVILVGLILLVISIPTKQEKESIRNNTGSNITEQGITSGEDYCEYLERRLEEMLSSIKGIGKVQVMITLKDLGESVVEKDDTEQESINNDESTFSKSEETVYEKTGNETYPYVINTLQPQIQGVLVIAQGVESPVMQQLIMEGVMALFGIESHKISIINME